MFYAANKDRRIFSNDTKRLAKILEMTKGNYKAFLRKKGIPENEIAE